MRAVQAAHLRRQEEEKKRNAEKKKKEEAQRQKQRKQAEQYMREHKKETEERRSQANKRPVTVRLPVAVAPSRPQSKPTGAGVPGAPVVSNLPPAGNRNTGAADPSEPRDDAEKGERVGSSGNPNHEGQAGHGGEDTKGPNNSPNAKPDAHDVNPPSDPELTGSDPESPPKRWYEKVWFWCVFAGVVLLVVALLLVLYCRKAKKARVEPQSSDSEEDDY